MDAAGAAGVPVVVVQHDSPGGAPGFAVGTHGWELHPVVASRSVDLVLHKRLPGSFTGTGLEQWVRGRGVTTVTIAGHMTQHCVDTTARQAKHAGFEVEVLSDATGAVAYVNAAGRVTAEEMHRGHLTALHASLAAVATTGEWEAALGTWAVLPIDGPIHSAAVAREGAGSVTAR